MALNLMLLLVEDDFLIIDVLEHALTEGGFEVTKAESGTAALALLEADAVKFRAVITDVRLGAGPDGWEVARRARELVLNMPIVYMSGDSTHDWASKGVPGSLSLAKPFAAAQLVTAVSTLITQADLHAQHARESREHPE